jgi:hypothetical protein
VGRHRTAYRHSDSEGGDSALIAPTLLRLCAGQHGMMSQPSNTNDNADKSASRSASTEQYRPDLSRMEEIIADHDDSLKPRARIEFVVIQRLLLDLEAAGYTVTIDTRGDDPSDAFEMDGDIYAALVRIFNLDECYIGTEKAGKKSEVFLVLGNSGWDVISDYGTSLDPVIAPITDWAEQFETLPVVGVYPLPRDPATHCNVCQSPLESHGDCSNKDCETHKVIIRVLVHRGLVTEVDTDALPEGVIVRVIDTDTDREVLRDTDAAFSCSNYGVITDYQKGGE